MDRALLAKAQDKQHQETMDKITEDKSMTLDQRQLALIQKHNAQLGMNMGQQQEPLIDMPTTARRSLNMAERQAELIRIRDGDKYKDEYKIISGRSILECEKNVKEYLGKGYHPIGGINFVESYKLFTQAVYRKAFKTRTSETSLLDTNEPSLIDLSPTTSAGGGKKHKTTRNNKTKKRH
jgi:hypothetical protein